ncbi:MAG: site-specific integrase [Phycisphaerales bacterium]|nr:MAG: site-specific integrase [Phycisphaerales bacterium]
MPRRSGCRIPGTRRLIDTFAKHRKRPLNEHIAEWHQSLLDKGTTQKHADLVRGQAQRVIEDCRFTSWPDLSAFTVQAFLGGLRAVGRSVQTCNFYLQAIKQFCRSMVQEGQAPGNPLVHLHGGNVRTDRRHDRRAFNDDKLRLLLETTRNGATRYGMTGAERAMLYRLAAETGLRAGEIRSLSSQSFDLEGNPPTVTVEAAFSKHCRKDVQPLPSPLAVELQAFVVTQDADASVFRRPRPDAVVTMLRADRVDARSAWMDEASDDKDREQREKSSFLAYRDEAGRVADFHAFRRTFITNLARGGVHPKQAQDLARHSDINLTMG